jgi:hypothetical protein
MSGRGRGYKGRGGRGYNGPQTENKTQKADKSDKTRKTLTDYVYYVGSAKKASDFSVITEFLINHIRQKYECGNDIANALETRTEVDFIAMMPQLVQSSATDQDVKNREEQQFLILYEAEIKRFVDRKSTYQSNLDKASALLWAQCNKSLQSKLLSRSDYNSIKGKPIEILKAIEEHSISFLEHQYDAVIVLDSVKSFLTTKQKEDEDLVDYTRRFKSSRNVMESHLGGKFKFLKLAEQDSAWDKTDVTIQNECMNVLLAGPSHYYSYRIVNKQSTVPF